MAPMMKLKWTPRILFAACAAAGVGAWALFEDHVQQQQQQSSGGGGGSEHYYHPGGGGGGDAFGWWEQCEKWLQLPRFEEEGFSSTPYLPPLPSDRVSRRAAPDAMIADRRPSTSCPNLLVRHDDMLLLFRDEVLVARFASLDDYQTYARDQEEGRKQQQHRGNTPPPGGCPVLYVEPEAAPQGRRRYRRRDAMQKRGDRGTVRGLSAAFWDWQHLGAVPRDRPMAASMPREEKEEEKDGEAAKDGVDSEDDGAKKKRRKLLASLAAYNADAMDVWLRSDLVKSAAEARAAATVSDNAMDPHWGGVRWTQQAIDSGKYDTHTLLRPTA